MKSFIAAFVFVTLTLPISVHAEFSKNVGYSSAGEEVKVLQKFLTDKGYFTGPVSGSFYSLTKKAVASFQKSYGIATTGFFGPTTRGVANYLLSSTGVHALDPGLVGYWNFDAGSGATASDSSASGNTGTLTNSPTWTTGKAGQALMFDGVSSYVSTSPTLNQTKGSISVWVNTTATLNSGKSYTVFSGSGPGNLVTLLFNGYGSGSDWEFSVRGNYGNTIATVSPKIASNTTLQGWHHLVATWDVATGVSLYLDGVLVSNKSGTTGAITTTQQTISTPTNAFKGTIDEVKLYNKILTSAEVSVLYGTTNAAPTTTPGNPSPAPLADVFPPLISSVTTATVSTTGATITWTTNEIADGIVEYGTTLSYGSIVPVHATRVTSHSMNITGLTQGTTYHYRVVSKDAAGNIGRSGDMTFVTSVPAAISLSALTPGVALDLGVYNPPALPSCTKTSVSITDYSRFTYDPVNNKMLMFGGGHVAVPRDDVDALDLTSSSPVWTSEYPSTQVADMHFSNYDSTKGGWIANGHPMTRHSYDMFTYAPNKNEFVLLAPQNTGAAGPYCLNADMAQVQLVHAGYAWHYNATTKMWRTTSPINFGSVSGSFANASEYDPVSGNIVIITRNGIYLYNPVTEKFSQPVNFSRADLTYANNLVYYPPNQKMYLVLHDGTTFEVSLDRTNFANSSITKVALVGNLRPVKNPAATVTTDEGETGWAYDSVNKILGGGVYNGLFYVIDPIAKTIKSTTMKSSSGNAIGGVTYMHTLDFDTSHGAFIFIAKYVNPATPYAPVYRTWAYKYDGTASSGGSVTPNVDATAPVISSIASAAVTTSSASISWVTNEASDSSIEYGTTLSYGSTIPVNVTLLTTHAMSMTSLISGTTYHYRVVSKDAAGNIGRSGDMTFVTQTGTVSTSTSTTPGLVGYWALDEVTGVGTNDYSGNNRLGILTNSPVPVVGKIGNALRFNGTNSYVVTPSTTSGTRGSVSVWVSPSAMMGTSRTYPVFKAGSGGDFIELYFDSYASNNNPWTFRVRGGYGNVLQVAVPVTSNVELQKWQHLVATWDNTSGISLYVNGVLKATLSGATGKFTTGTQTIGADIGSFAGVIDEVRVYNTVLKASDVAQLYASTVVATKPTGPDTLAPTVPVRLTGNPSSETTIELDWYDSADNVGVTGYKVYRNNVHIGTTALSSYTDTGLTSNTTYSYMVAAYDAAGNVSALTPVSTSPSGKPPVPLALGSNGVIPGPGPQPVIPEYALRISESKYSGTTWKMISYDNLPWIHLGGDWRDKNFVLQGTIPWATATVRNNATEQKVTFDVTALITNQLGNSSQKIPNRGWIVQSGSGSTIGTYYTKEATDSTKRPVLRVVTTTGSIDIPVSDDIGLFASSFVPNGAQTSQSISSGSYMALWFDLRSISGTVTSASLTLTTTNVQYGGASSQLNLFPVDLTKTFAPIPLQSGIASKYKDDIGLEKDPNVLFMERYQDTNLQGRGWAVDSGLQKFTVAVGDTDPADPSYVPLAPGVKAYKMTVPTGAFGGDFGRWPFWSNLGYEPEEIYIRTYARMSNSFDSMGGKFPFGFDGTYADYQDWNRNPATGRMLTRPDAPDKAGNGGGTSNGMNGWSARGGYYAQDCDSGSRCLTPDDPQTNPLYRSGYRRLDYYAYWADQPELKGSIFLWDKGALGLVQKNKWFAIDQYTKLNTVNADGSGNKDGILRVWIDGRLAYENTQFRVRHWPGNPAGAKNIKVYAVWLNFYNGGLDPANSPLVAYLSNTVVSKSFIGPSNLYGAPAISQTVSTKFKTGDRVSVVTTLNVRGTPAANGTLLGSQLSQAKGIVTGGPTVAGGITWWNVNYDTGVDGWSSEDYLVTYTPSATPSTPVPPATPPATNSPATSTPVQVSSTTTPSSPVTSPTISASAAQSPSGVSVSGGNGTSGVTYYPSPSVSQPSQQQTGAAPAITKNLYRGVRGNDVITLQKLLVVKGYLAADSVTGTFGNLTFGALKQYQCALSIICAGNESDGYGVLGPRTRSIINPILQSSAISIVDVAPSVTTTASPASFAVTTFTRALGRGMEGGDVFTLQTYLAKDPSLFTATPNGYFGKATEAGVGKFQIKYGILPDQTADGYGVFGKRTRGKLVEVLK